MWQLVILSVEYYENVSMVMYLQLNFDGTSRISQNKSYNAFEKWNWIIHYNWNVTLYFKFSFQSILWDPISIMRMMMQLQANISQ